MATSPSSHSTLHAYQPALQAAQAAAGQQNYPAGALYVVATPIGNLADISLRALHVLGLVDAVACEDTRHTGALLHSYGLHKPLLALHQHNEAQAAQAVLARLEAGERVAYVSDAGTPGISDPGARLCAALQAAGKRCIPLPGASSVTALVSVAGLPAADGESAATGFAFVGFLPSRGADRARALLRLASAGQPCVLLESPHRMEQLARELAADAALAPRRITVGRELTKQFEEVATLVAAELPGWLAASPQRGKGEFALVLHPPVSVAPSGTTEGETLPPTAARVLRLLLEELPLKTAARLAADLTGEPRNALYQAALVWKKEADGG
jgi:16S rRNA (cytidine1402-2'-O)-methyltransferase